MFTPLTPAQYVSAIGLVARDRARDDEPADEFHRGQLLSAYSGSRHLAVELTWFAAELQAFTTAVADEVETAAHALPAPTPDTERQGLRTLAAGLRGTADPVEAGRRVSKLMAQLRERRSPHTAALQARCRALLAQLCDREVSLLADAIESGRSR